MPGNRRDLARALTRPLRRALIVLLVATSVVAVALLIAQDQETLTIRSPVGADDPRYAAYVAALVGSDLTSGNRYEVLVNVDEMFPSMVAAIDEARERIKFETYVYRKGSSASGSSRRLSATRRPRHHRARRRRCSRHAEHTELKQLKEAG